MGLLREAARAPLRPWYASVRHDHAG